MTGAVNLIGRGNAALSAVVSPTTLQGYRSGKGTAQTSNYVTCSASFGTPGYTYLWTFVSGDTDIYPYSGSSASTLFAAFFENIDNFEAIWKCVVTDSAAIVVDSNTVTISLVRYS